LPKRAIALGPVVFSIHLAAVVVVAAAAEEEMNSAGLLFTSHDEVRPLGGCEEEWSTGTAGTMQRCSVKR
jgi:hypothetical protein